MELELEPVLHEYVPPPVAVNKVAGLVQVSTKEEGEIAAEGDVWLTETDVLALAVHPFEPVTVNVYVPAVDTDMEPDDAPVFHE